MRLPCPPPRSVGGRTGRPRGLCQALQYGEQDVGVGPDRTGRGRGVVPPAAMCSAMAKRTTSSLVIAVGPFSRSSPCFPSTHATEVPLPALFPCRYAPFSPARVEHSVPAAHARLASWPRRRCAWATAGESARWCCQPAAARGYRPPWPSGDGRGARRRVCTSRPSSNRFASVGGSTQISVSRLTRSAARARI